MAEKSRDERREERKRRRASKQMRQTALADADPETRREYVWGAKLRLRRQRTGG